MLYRSNILYNNTNFISKFAIEYFVSEATWKAFLFFTTWFIQKVALSNPRYRNMAEDKEIML